ncbi:MAG: hypothetical protein GSR84_02950 [Desulfurococcales archaeon]|nr:hypothetical protein [Desulfurococcales archaeon]
MSAAARCQRCGAPLELTPETIVAVCSYCGYPNWTMQAYVYPIELIPAEQGKARGFFDEYLRSDPDMRGLRGVKLRSVETVYIPFYTIQASADTRYYGVAKVTLTRVRMVRSGGKTEVRTETRFATVVVEGEYSASYNLPLAARRSVERSYIDPLARHLVESKPRSIPLQEVDWEAVKGTVLASEVPPQDAEVWARDEVCDRLQKEVEDKMSDQARKLAAAQNPGWVPSMVAWLKKRIPCKPREVKLSPLLLVPAVIAYYTYQGGIYKVVFAGWSGRKVYAEEPLTPGQRLAYLGGAVAASGILGGGGAALAAGGEHTLVGLLLLLAGIAGSYLATSKAVSDVRVEKG